MKAILEFELPDDSSDHSKALNGHKYHSVLWDLDQFLRSKVKYGIAGETEKQACQMVRDELRDLMNGAGVCFEE